MNILKLAAQITLDEFERGRKEGKREAETLSRWMRRKISGWIAKSKSK